jgi:similar to stage IV sporulation protein
MTNKFSDQVGGFVSLRLRGDNLEKIINMALARGIYIWDIKRRDDCIYLKVRNSGYEALKTIAAEQNFKIELLQSQGLPFYKTIMKRRMGLLGGAILFILTLYVMSSFVWFIQVSGNNKVDRTRILMTAAHYGIQVGAGKWTFSRTAVEEAMLRDISELAYVQCDIRGVKVNIKVVEKILPEQNITGPCHIVANRDGVIEEVLVLDGQAHVKAGDVVARGDILISGIVIPPAPPSEIENMPPADTGTHQVRARGQVKARTWYEGYGECSRKLEEKVFTGKQFTQIYLESPWRKFWLKGKGENPFTICEQNEKMWHSPAGNWGLVKIISKEQSVNVTEYTEAQAIEIARTQALQKLHEIMPGSLTISDSHINILSSPSDSMIRIRVSAETIEDIGMAQPINGGEISN